MTFKKIDDQFFASPQISPADVEQAAAEGITTIVNNRPDGEDPMAPQGAMIAAAAKAHGLDYIAIPISRAGFSHPQIDTLAALLGGDKGPVLGYCASGTRSTFLWSLASARLGMDADEIARLAGNAGYNIAPIRAMVDALANSAD